MEKTQVDTDNYILYSPDSLKYITDNMFDILDKKLEEYKQLFGVKEYKKIKIYFFDSIEKFRECVFSFGEGNVSLPDYAAGVYDIGKMIAYLPADLKTGTLDYYWRLYYAPHELFHMMYLDIILKRDRSKRITWYDEGMAQLLSGENSDLENEESFKAFFENVKSETKRLPNLNQIVPGTSFCNDDYNGYTLSYLAARYLREKLDDEEFKALLGDFNKILEYGSSILEEMMQYYTDKFAIKSLN